MKRERWRCAARFSPIETAERGGDLAAAALRWFDDRPGDDESRKAVLLAAERLESEGDLDRALDLCFRVGQSEGGTLRGEAAVRAGKIASAMKDYSAAEEWFLRAADATGDPAERKGRIERAAAGSFLHAREAEERESWDEAADRYARTASEYDSTSVAVDAIRAELRCRTAGDDAERAIAVAAALSARTAGDTLSADAVRFAAARFAERGNHGEAGDLLQIAFSIAQRPADLLAGAAEYEAAGAVPEADGLLTELTERFARHEAAAEGAFRLAMIRLKQERYDEAASWFDRSLASGASPGVSAAQVRFHEGEARLAAGDSAAAAAVFHKAAAAGEGATGRAEWYAARAHFAAAAIARGALDRAIAAWRRGERREGPADLLASYVEDLRKGIAARFENITTGPMIELAGALELYGRTAHLREWERGNIPSAGLVEPYFSDAAALYASAGATGRPGANPYASLADTLVRFGEEELERNAPPAAADIDTSVAGWFDAHSDALSRRLLATERADALWSTAMELYEMQESGPAVTEWNGRAGVSVALRGAEANHAAAALLREAPLPPSASEEERRLYGDLLREKAASYEERAAAWIEKIEEATAGDAVRSLSQRLLSVENGNGEGRER